MFKSTIHYNDSEIGKIDYLLDYWRFDITDAEGEIIGFVLNGNKRQPNLDSVAYARTIISSLEGFKEAAIQFCEHEKIQEFMKGLGSLVLDEVYVSTEVGTFDFDFGLTGWEDSNIVIHFVDGKPNDFSLGD